MRSPPIRVFLVDDHEVVRRGIAELLDAHDDIAVVGDAPDVHRALTRIPGAMPDVAVLDLKLADGSGIDLCRSIRSSHPEVACLLLTSFADDEALIEAAEAGASAYVLKQIRGNQLVETIRSVAAGVDLLDHAEVRMAHERLREAGPGLLDDLTDQERRILGLIGEGLSNREIATELYLAEKTVKNYVSNLLAKLGMERRTQAAAFAARLAERDRHRFR